MTEERDIAGFVLPFAAGVLATTLLQTNSLTIFYGQATASILMAGSATLCMIHPQRKHWTPWMISCVIILSGLCCGLLTGFTSVTTIHKATHIISDHFVWLGEKISSLITALPFENKITGSIISALITGDRTEVPAEVTSAFRDSGASHILALSGLHLGIIYGTVSNIFSFAGNALVTKRIKSLLIITICGIYTAATGAGPSLARAFLFILIKEMASLTGRHSSISSVLMTALILQLIITPESISQPGFQLSYGAMAGIAFIFPWLRDMWTQSSEGIMKKIWNSAAISISCQITTGPLAYIYFGTFPKHFLLTNLIALPLTCSIIPIALITLGLDLLGICPSFLVKSTEALVQMLITSLKTIATM